MGGEVEGRPRQGLPASPSDPRWTALRALGRGLARPLQTPEVMRVVHRELARVFDAPICLFAVFDPVAQQVEVVWQIHDEQELPGGSFPLGDGFTSRVIRTGQPMLIRDWSGSGPSVQVHYATEHTGLPQSAITAPVIFDEQVRGVLSVQSYRAAAFDEDDLAFLATVADQVALAIFGPMRGPAPTAAVDPVLSSMAVGVLVLDRERRLVHVNHAARRLLCVGGARLIIGRPVDQPQDGQWPLGTQTLTDSVRPLLEKLSSGQEPLDEVVDVELARDHHLACSAAALLSAGQTSGSLLLLRQRTATQAA